MAATILLPVGEYSRQEVAKRAGVDAEYVDRLVELGILEPGTGDTFSQGDVRRARWMHSLELAGVPLDEMATAVRDEALSFTFLDASAFDRFVGLSNTTFRELSERTGISLNLLMVLREAFGYAEPRPEDLVREEELTAMPMIELLLSSGVSPGAIDRMLRAYGDGLRRIVATETDLYKTEVMQAFIDSGMNEMEMMEAQAELGSRLAPLIEQSLLAVYRGQQEHTWRNSFAEYVEIALERAGLYRPLHRPPAMCFLDITGYTRLTEERGDKAAADLAASLAKVVRRSSQQHGGQPVKWLGDGVMFFFPNPGDAVLGAVDMVEVVSDQSLPPARVGIHAGPVIFQEGDYFGRTVNIAARIAEYARPGEVLVTREVVDAADGASVTFSDVGPVELKGVSGALHLFSVRRAE
jgi:adenylate cyclase